MQSIPVLWRWEQLAELHAQGESHKEFRGPQNAPLTFDLDVLENSAQNGRTYLHIGISASDPARSHDAKRGSSWVPLSTSFLWYKDGELDMPTARDIYERPF